MAKQPFATARVTLIEGEQGSGKSATATARVVDAYHLDCVENYCRDVLKIGCIVKGYDSDKRIAKIIYNKNTKYIRIPEQYTLHSDMRIFANYHLYGIPYAYCESFQQILTWLKAGVIRDGKLVIDEYYIGGNAREGMKKLGRELVKQSFQYRKMQLEVILITPMSRLVDWTARLMPTERILCSYDEHTGYVNLEIRRKGERGVLEVSYDSRPYRKNYWTNERINS